MCSRRTGRSRPGGWGRSSTLSSGRSGEILRQAGLYTELDRDVLGQFLVARSGGSGRTGWPPPPSGPGTRSWLRSGRLSRAPISGSAGSAPR